MGGKAQPYRLVAFEGPARTSTRFECIYCPDSYIETDLVVEYVDEMAAFCSCGARMIDSEAMAYRVARHLAHNGRVEWERKTSAKAQRQARGPLPSEDRV